MKRPLRRLACLGLTVLFAAGCHKKQETTAEISQESEQRLPKEEQVKPMETPAADAPADSTSGAPIVATAASDGAEKAAYEAWFKKYHLDLNDPKMLDEDPDHDGFTNREEFLADTDPLDPNSRPGFHKIIRLKEYSEVRLPVVLESVEGDKAKIKHPDQTDGRMETIKVGDTVKGLPLKVIKVESRKDTDKNGELADLSQVTLEDPSTKEKIVMTKDLPAKTSASYAVLVSTDGKTTLKVHQGDVFTWPGETGATYQVLDLTKDQAVLQQIENKKTWTIPRL